MIIYIQYLTLLKKEICRGTTKPKDLNFLLYIMLTLQQRLILSDDIEVNPGHGFSAPNCNICGKVVKINNRCLICSMCADVVHAKCSTQPSNQTIQARIARYYTCNRCLHTQLPLFNVSNLDSNYDMCNTANDNSLSIQSTNSDITNGNKTIY